MSKLKFILIVEDDDDIRDVLRFMVSSHGYEPITARSGQEALDILKKGTDEEPSLILLDWSMPMMSGEEFIELGWATDLIAPIPIIIVSVNPPTKLPIGVVKTLQKPFDLNSLFHNIDKYCSKVRPDRVLAEA